MMGWAKRDFFSLLRNKLGKIPLAQHICLAFKAVLRNSEAPRRAGPAECGAARKEIFHEPTGNLFTIQVDANCAPDNSLAAPGNGHGISGRAVASKKAILG